MSCNHALAFSSKKWELECILCKKRWGEHEIRIALELLDGQPSLADMMVMQNENFIVVINALLEMGEMLNEMSNVQKDLVEREVQRDRVVRSVPQEDWSDIRSGEFDLD